MAEFRNIEEKFYSKMPSFDIIFLETLKDIMLIRKNILDIPDGPERYKHCVDALYDLVSWSLSNEKKTLLETRRETYQKKFEEMEKEILKKLEEAVDEEEEIDIKTNFRPKQTTEFLKHINEVFRILMKHAADKGWLLQKTLEVDGA